MLRTVADDTPRPADRASREEGTGSPDAMYSRTSVASRRLDRSDDVISTRPQRLLIDYTRPAHAWVLAGDHFIESSAASRPFTLPCFTAISSARMLTAISCGVTAPMSSPMGAWIW